MNTIDFIFSLRENSNGNHETQKLFDIMYIWFLYNIYSVASTNTCHVPDKIN